MNSGARALTAIISSNLSGVAVQTLSRHVAAATLTTPCTTPNWSSAAAITCRGAAGSAMSASTNDVGVPSVVSSAAKAVPLVVLRPAMHEAGSAIGDHLPGDSLAEPLRAAADDDDLARQLSRHVPILCCSSASDHRRAWPPCTWGRLLTSGTPTSQNAPPPVHEYASVCRAITVVRSLCRARRKCGLQLVHGWRPVRCCSPSPRRGLRSRRTPARGVGHSRSGC